MATEADFYGSMDGASKFVKGDAVAGLIILFVNIVGGIILGVVSHKLALGEAARTYTMLAIGDALVAQIPALLISVAAAMVVSRVGKEQDVGSQIAKQVFNSPRSLAITSGVIDLRDVIFFFSLIGLFLYANMLIVDLRKSG